MAEKLSPECGSSEKSHVESPCTNLHPAIRRSLGPGRTERPALLETPVGVPMRSELHFNGVIEKSQKPLLPDPKRVYLRIDRPDNWLLYPEILRPTGAQPCTSIPGNPPVARLSPCESDVPVEAQPLSSGSGNLPVARLSSCESDVPVEAQPLSSGSGNLPVARLSSCESDVPVEAQPLSSGSGNLPVARLSSCETYVPVEAQPLNSGSGNLPVARLSSCESNVPIDAQPLSSESGNLPVARLSSCETDVPVEAQPLSSGSENLPVARLSSCETDVPVEAQPLSSGSENLPVARLSSCESDVPVEAQPLSSESGNPPVGDTEWFVSTEMMSSIVNFLKSLTFKADSTAVSTTDGSDISLTYFYVDGGTSDNNAALFYSDMGGSSEKVFVVLHNGNLLCPVNCFLAGSNVQKLSEAFSFGGKILVACLSMRAEVELKMYLLYQNGCEDITPEMFVKDDIKIQSDSPCNPRGEANQNLCVGDQDATSVGHELFAKVNELLETVGVQGGLLSGPDHGLPSIVSSASSASDASEAADVVESADLQRRALERTENTYHAPALVNFDSRAAVESDYESVPSQSGSLDCDRYCCESETWATPQYFYSRNLCASTFAESELFSGEWSVNELFGGILDYSLDDYLASNDAFRLWAEQTPPEAFLAGRVDTNLL